MMRRDERILILSGELGDGHKQAAAAIAEAAGLHAPGTVTKVADMMAVASPRLHNVGKYLYLQGVRIFPSVYGFLYDKTRNSNSLTQLLKMFHVHGLNRLLTLFREFQPTVIVSTFPIAAAAVGLLKSAGMIRVPAVTVITDHAYHRYWLSGGTDLYAVGSGYVRRALLRHGIPDERIAVTGIPVRSSFCRDYDAQQLRRRHGLSPDRPVVLMMGGGYGMIDRSIIELLSSDALPEAMQFVIVCGHNRKLREQLEHALAEAEARQPGSASRHAIRLTGYIDYVHELMACADLIVTKPGGLTTSEALASGLPMLLYRPLPGQEQDNARYLLEAGAALAARDAGDLTAKMTKLFTQPDSLDAMRRNLQTIGTRDSAKSVLFAALEARHAEAASRAHVGIATHA